MTINQVVIAVFFSLVVVNIQAGAANSGNANSGGLNSGGLNSSAVNSAGVNLSSTSSSNNSVNKIKAAPFTSTKKLEVPTAVKMEAVAPTTTATANPVRVLLVPDKETTIASTMAARIITFNGTLGQSFRAGDTLVAFDCEEALARVEMSKAELSGAIEQHEAKVKMQGLEQASDVEVALAASASNKAKAQLNLNQAQVGQCKIYAPWAGRVAKANVKNHMTVTPGQPLMELVNSGPLKLKMNLPSSMLASTKVGTKFNIIIDETAQTYQASVSAINSRVDPVSQTVEIEAKLLKSYKELLAGMSGVASF
jgi:membrane fusion protein, multidrug efflux system